MRGSEAVPVRGGEPFERGDDTVAERVGVTERTAEERREAEPQHGTEIAPRRGTGDPVIPAARGPVPERDGEPPRGVPDHPPRVDPHELAPPRVRCPPPAP